MEKTKKSITIRQFVINCLIIISLTPSLFSQTTYTSGTATTEYYAPSFTYYNYSYSQMIYLQSEIATAGSIQKVRFYWDGSANQTRNITLYLGHIPVSKTTFSGTTDWVAVSGLTSVYTGNYLLTTTAGWHEITLTTPFAYNNTDNLLVAFDDNTGNSTNGGSARLFCYTATTGNTRTLVKYIDASNIDPASPGTASYNTVYRPNIQLVINTCSVVGGTASPATSPICTGTSTAVSCSGHTTSGTTYQWEQSADGSTGWANVTGGSGATTSTYTTPNLTATTYYRMKVTNGCSAYSTNACVTVNSGTPVGGTASAASSTLCSGSSTVLSLSGQTGNIQWQQSADGVSGWANVTGGSGATTTSYTTPGLTSTTYYRAELSFSPCPGLAYSNSVSVTVDAGCVLMNNNPVSLCSGTFYDAGGISGQYAINESYVKTITPSTAGAKLRVAFSSFATEASYDKLYIYNGPSTTSPLVSGSPFSGSTLPNSGNIITSSAANGELTFRFTSDNSNNGNGWVADLSCYVPSPMTLISSTSTQSVTTPVAPFTVSQQIIGVQVVTTGTLSPLSITSLSFNTNGTTNPGNDIISATLYYTGTSSTFNTAISFGSVVSQPDGTFTFNDSYNLSEGVNYFWLAYDVPLAAIVTNYLDAECTSITVEGNTITPTVTNPGNGRMIANTYLHSNNNSVISCNGAYFDDGDISGNYATSTNYTKTFVPESGKVMRISFNAFNTESGSDLLKIYDGPNTSSTLMGTWSGTNSPGVVTATSATGELTVNFNSGSFTTASGWDASISCVSLPPNCPVYSSPANGATNQPTNTTITWVAPATDGTHNPATSYKLFFGTSAAANEIVNGSNIGNVTSWGMSLNTNTTYYWKVVAVNASGEATGCSTVWSFTTALTPTMTNYSVCPSGCDFTSIKSAYNACTAATPYVITVKSGYAGETYPIVFDNTNSVPTNRNGANSITIRPDAGFTYSFTGAAAKVLEFSGDAKYITIEGRQGGSGTANGFVFQNTSTTLPVINVTGNSSNIKIQYCKIQGRNLSSGILDIRTPGASGIKNITIDNNEICPNGAFATGDGIYSEGTSSIPNTNITITNNKVYDIFNPASVSHGIFFGFNEFNYGCTISSNSVYFTSSKTPTSSTSWYGIVIKGNNHTVSNNYVGGTAPACGGTPLTISPSTYDMHIYGLTVTGNSAASTTVVSDNTINNILLNTRHRSIDRMTGRGENSSLHSLAGLMILDGTATVTGNMIGGSTAGSITVVNTNTTNPSTINDGVNFGYSSEIVGIAYYTKNGNINNSGNTVQGLWCYPSSTATTNLNARVIGILACTDGVSNTGYIHTLSNNTIGGTGGLKAGNATTSDAFIIGIRTTSGNGSIYIHDNVISNLWVNASGDYGFIRGIHNDAGIRAEILNNTVSNLVCAAENTLPVGEDVRNRTIIGIICDNDGGFLDHFFVNENTVYDLRSTATTAKVNVIGIYYRHAQAPVYGRVFRNKVYSINAASSNQASTLIGIWAYGQNTITYNNMVVLGTNISAADGAVCPAAPANTGGYELRGIDNNYGKNEYYYNSVLIGGTCGAGASNTYAYKYSNLAPDILSRVFRNNLFVNTRSTISGTAKHYAFCVNPNEVSYSSDYNYYYVSGTNGILFNENGTDHSTIASWTAATGKDANSSGGNSPADDPLFVAPNTCACDLNITDAASPVIGIGTTSGIPGYILEDFFGNPRSVSNDIGAIVVGALMPVELLDFFGNITHDKTSLLRWNTASETNNSHFVVERSSDGKEFVPIATVLGNGNSNSPIAYKAIDKYPQKGMNYYRLKQVDFNGNYSYSKMIQLNYENESQNSFSVNVFPNPFSNAIYLSISADEEIQTTISIINVSGEVIHIETVSSQQDNYKIQMDRPIPSGIYFIKVESDRETKHIKLIKTND